MAGKREKPKDIVMKFRQKDIVMKFRQVEVCAKAKAKAKAKARSRLTPCVRLA